MGSQQSKNVTGVPSPLPSDGRGEGQGEVRAEGGQIPFRHIASNSNNLIPLKTARNQATLKRKFMVSFRLIVITIFP